MTTARQEQDRSQRMAESVAIDLRAALIDAERELEEFRSYVTDWELQVVMSKEDPATHDPRSFTEDYVVTRALDMLESLTHVHTGSTRYSNIRRARTRLVQLAQSARQHG